MKLPFKQPQAEEEAKARPQMSAEERATIAREAMAACNEYNLSRRKARRETVLISTNGGPWESSRRPLNVGPWR